MTQQAFGATPTGATQTGRQSSTGFYSQDVAAPAGRAMANGDTRILVDGIVMYIGGVSGSVSATIYVGGASLGVVAGAASGAQAVGGATTTRALISSGVVEAGCFLSASANVGQNLLSGHTVIDRNGGSWPNSELAGYYDWFQAPAAPATPTVVISGLSAAVTWVAPDNGGSAITGYDVQYSKDPTFATGVTTVGVGNVLTTTITGLDGGATYYFRVCAKNEVTTRAGTVGARSAARSATIPSGPQYDTGSAWIYPQWFYDDGTAWVPVAWFYDNGTAWVPLL